MAAASPTPAAAGTFAPLAVPVFAVLWVATVLSNTGSFVRDVASAWLVTELAAGPTAVTLLQAAAALPVFLLAVPAGVLADLFDRRWLLICAQLLMLAASATLLVLAATATLNLAALLALTLCAGVGAALAMPAWQAIVPALVPPAALRPAIALNALGFNLSRAIGPALGGLVLAAAGAAVAYGLDVLSYLLVIGALCWWRPARSGHALAAAPAERFPGALRAGLRHARHSAPLRRVLLRIALFAAAASVVWALLPLIARELLAGDARFYGVMLGAIGVGALGGALWLPRWRQRWSSDPLLLAATLVAAVVPAVLALAPVRALAIALLALWGLAWIVVMTLCNSLAQAVLPDWVRGRGLALYLMAFNGALALGSVGWGLLAGQIGLTATLAAGAATLALVGCAAYPLRLPAATADTSPAASWPQPLIAAGSAVSSSAPVWIQVEYTVPPERQPAFFAALRQLAGTRRRDGASWWQVHVDAADPQQIVETFMVTSWDEHLRQHQRVTQADASLRDEIRLSHVGVGPPRVRHLLARD